MKLHEEYGFNTDFLLYGIGVLKGQSSEQGDYIDPVVIATMQSLGFLSPDFKIKTVPELVKELYDTKNRLSGEPFVQ